MPEHAENIPFDIESHTAAHIERVTLQLAQNIRPSTIVAQLCDMGVGCVLLIYIFKQVTGARLMDLKQFSQWWSEDGLTDIEQFDVSALALLASLPPT